MAVRLNKIAAIPDWEVVGATQEGFAFVSAGSIESFYRGLDQLQQQTGEQYTKFNVGLGFGGAALSAVEGKDVSASWSNKKDTALATIVPADCGFMFKAAGWLRKLECCKGPQRNTWNIEHHQAKADLEDTVCFSLKKHLVWASASRSMVVKVLKEQIITGSWILGVGDASKDNSIFQKDKVSWRHPDPGDIRRFPREAFWCGLHSVG